MKLTKYTQNILHHAGFIYKIQGFPPRCFQHCLGVLLSDRKILQYFKSLLLHVVQWVHLNEFHQWVYKPLNITTYLYHALKPSNITNNKIYYTPFFCKTCCNFITACHMHKATWHCRSLISWSDSLLSDDELIFLQEYPLSTYINFFLENLNLTYLIFLRIMYYEV